MRRWRIDTAERISFHYEVAGMATRLMAWGVDLLFLGVLKFVLVLFVASIGRMGMALIVLIFFTLDFCYFLLWELRGARQSLGKRYLRLRVVAADGGRLGFATCLLRTLLRPIDMLPGLMPPMVLGGAVASFLDRGGRRLGDRVAGTLVAAERSRELSAPPAALKSRENTFHRETSLRQRILTRVTREERDLIHDLALRRDDLDDDARDRLFARAAGYFRARFGVPESLDFLSDEQVVLNLSLTLTED